MKLQELQKEIADYGADCDEAQNRPADETELVERMAGDILRTEVR